MSSRVPEAIVTRWDAQSLDATFPGGIWLGGAPSGTVFPYAVFFDLGEFPQGWSTNSVFVNHLLQFDIFLEEDNTNDPGSLLGTHVRTFKAAMDFAPLTMPAGEGHVEETRWGSTRITKEDQGIWHAQLDYTIRRRKPIDPSPA